MGWRACWGCVLGLTTPLFGTSAAGQVLLVPEGRPTIDGSLRDWPGTAVAALVPSGENGSGEPVPPDLNVSIELSGDDSYLYAAFRWVDDVLDVASIAYDSSTWIDSQGQRRDRMYLHDNLRLRLTGPRGRYDLWVTPDPERALQWERSSEETAGLGARVAAGVEDGSIVVEVAVPWTLVSAGPSRDGEVVMNVVATDGDAPGDALQSKIPELSWVEWTRALNLPTASQP